jgi:hypothetical protein
MTLYHYAQKFNSLCQYGGYHMDTNAKKMERFRDGLDCKLYERLNLIEPDNFHDLVNKAISQEDAMEKGQRDKKRQAGSASGSGTNKMFRFVKKNVPNSSQQSSTGRWAMKPSQSKPSGNFQFRNTQQQAPTLMHPRVMPVNVAVTIVDSWSTISMTAPSPGRTGPTRRIKVQGPSRSIRLRSQWCKFAKAS